MPTGRLPYLDGLRGLAALAVALFHFHGYVGALDAAVPGAVDVAVRHGYLGVNVFFVLSGFVIAHTLRRARYSGGFVGRFALRRSLRLDPPYWVAIVLAALSIAWDPHHDPARIRAAVLLVHALYLQKILHYPELLQVFWSLTIEVQLYLAFALTAWLAQRIEDGLLPGERDDDGRVGGVLLALVGLSLLGSAWIGLFAWSKAIGAFFPMYWYMFALGAFARWSLESRFAAVALAAFSAMLVWRSFHIWNPGPATSAASAVAIRTAVRWAPLGRALGGRVLAWLGRISYSFYLLHALAGGMVLHVLLDGHPHSALRDALGVLVALAASAVAAQAMWWAVERPAMALSRRVRLDRRPQSPASGGCHGAAFGGVTGSQPAAPERDPSAMEAPAARASAT